MKILNLIFALTLIIMASLSTEKLMKKTRINEKLESNERLQDSADEAPKKAAKDCLGNVLDVACWIR